MLGERHVRDYRRQGFACVAAFVPPDGIAAFRREVDRIAAASAAAGFDPARVEMEPAQDPSGREPEEEEPDDEDRARAAVAVDLVVRIRIVRADVGR